MKTITITVDDGIYREAEATAAARATSVTALVEQFLERLAREGAAWPGAADPAEFARMLQREKDIRAAITNFSAADNLPRDQLYDRKTR